MIKDLRKFRIRYYNTFILNRFLSVQLILFLGLEKSLL